MDSTPVDRQVVSFNMGTTIMYLARIGLPLIASSLLLTGAAQSQTAATTKTTRTYDCTKAGNANKAACKTAAAGEPTTAAKAVAPSPVVTKTTTTRNYDCSKAGNANKAACKAAAAKPAAAPAAMPAAIATPRPTVARTTATSKTATAGADVHPNGPDGATAQCKDGTYSKSSHRSGTCAGHKGVATWY